MPPHLVDLLITTTTVSSKIQESTIGSSSSDYEIVDVFSLLQQHEQLTREKFLLENDILYENVQLELSLFNEYRSSSSPLNDEHLFHGNRLAWFKYLRKDGAQLANASNTLKNDKDLVCTAVRSYGMALQYASDELRSDPEVVLLAASNTVNSLEFALNLCKDRDYLKKLVAVGGCGVLEYLKHDEELINDRELTILAIKSEAFSFEHVADKFKDDKEIVLEAIYRWGDHLLLASDRLKNDRELIIEALKRSVNGATLRQYSHDIELVKNAIRCQGELYPTLSTQFLRNDREFAKEILLHSGANIIGCLPHELGNDRELAELSLQLNHYAVFGRLSRELKNDKEMIRMALGQYCASDILKYVSVEVLSDKEFCLELVELDQSSYFFITNTELLNDKQLLLKVIESYPHVFRQAIAELRNDRDCFEKSIKYGATALEYTPSDILSDKYLVMKCAEQYGPNLRDASEELQNDRQVLLHAIKFGQYMNYLPERYENDRELLEQVYHYYGYVPLPECFKNDRALSLFQARSHSFKLSSAPIHIKHDKEMVLEYLFHNSTPKYIPEKFCTDREVVYEAVKRNGSLIDMVSKTLRCDESIAYLASISSPSSLNKLHEWNGNKQFVLNLVTKSDYSYHGASQSLEQDRDFALQLASHGIISRYYERDRQVVLLGVQQGGGSNIFHCDLDFRSDREVMFHVLTKNANLLSLASKELRSDRELIIHAMETSIELAAVDALPFIAEELKNDREFILQISKHIVNVFHLPQHLRNDREIILNAVTKNGLNLQHLSMKLRNDKEIVLSAVKQNGNSIKYASKELQQDRQVVCEAIPTCDSFYFLSDELRNDKTFVLENIGKNGLLLRAVPHFQSDREVVLKAVSNNGTVLELVSDDLKADREIVKIAVQQHGESLMHTTEFRNDRDIVMAAVTSHEDALAYASYELRMDRQFILQAVRKNPKLLKKVERILKNDEEIVLAATEFNTSLLVHASYRLKHDVEFLKRLNNLSKNGLIENEDVELKYSIDRKGLLDSLQTIQTIEK